MASSQELCTDRGEILPHSLIRSLLMGGQKPQSGQANRHYNSTRMRKRRPLAFQSPENTMKKQMLKAAVIAAAFSLNVDAADQTDMEFDQGTVLIRCAAPDGHPQISRELFNSGFPHWITNLQKRANEGLITRVHYLGSLKEGCLLYTSPSPRDS